MAGNPAFNDINGILVRMSLIDTAPPFPHWVQDSVLLFKDANNYFEMGIQIVWPQTNIGRLFTERRENGVPDVAFHGQQDASVTHDFKIAHVTGATYEFVFDGARLRTVLSSFAFGQGWGWLELSTCAQNGRVDSPLTQVKRAGSWQTVDDGVETHQCAQCPFDRSKLANPLRWRVFLP